MAAKIRCAIYTRKSTEEGLEQEFNSLDAQREACAAYILSQRHEGWMEAKESYDDGGFSGGNMERPGLKRLLADVAAGRVDVIVVYKVDRLTRSLSDFARIVDVLDERGASFVSVTQAFNTTTSMGRLTLNVLLSFAQFEREVTGERIRDKIAASKAKGLWMGGPVPLGYRVEDRKLVIDEKEAATVRHIFSRYLALGSGQKLIEELHEQGYRTRVRKHGDTFKGGIPFQRGALFALLSNRVYLGEIVHKGIAHPGEHPPIIDRATWDKVQALIAANTVELKSAARSPRTSLLTGIIFDGHRRKMSPSHAQKKQVRYRYYITHASQVREGDPPAWRIPASGAEKAVVGKLESWLRDKRAIRAILPTDASAQHIASAIAAAESAASQITESHHKKRLVSMLVKQVQVDEERICIELDSTGLAMLAGQSLAPDLPPLSLIAPATKVRQGKATRLVIGGKDGIAGERDDKLIALLTQAHAARKAVFSARDQSIKQIAAQRRICRHRFMRLLRLSWLAPEITIAIAEGRQPANLTPMKLIEADLPLDWASQKALLGFA